MGFGAVAARRDGVCNVWLPGDAALNRLFLDDYKESETSCRAAIQLELYFNKNLKQFDITIDFNSFTKFGHQVLSQTANIPFGKVITYKKLALQIDLPNASRAVGRALATNPIPIILPCHRVISSSGAVGGYSGSGGIEMKKYLLLLEGYISVY